MRLKADLTLLAVSIVWGVAFLAQHYSAEFDSVYLFNGFGFLIAAVFLYAINFKRFSIKAGQWFWMSIAGTLLVIASALQQIGIFTTDLANAGFLTSLYTVFTPFVLFLLFKEKAAIIDLLAVVIAVAGAYFLSTGGQITFHAGDIYVAIGAIFWAIHIVILGKFGLKYDAISFSIGQFTVSAILNLILGFSLEPVWILAEPVFLGSLLFRAIFSIAFGYTLQVWGQQHTPPTDAALLLSLEAVFAAITGWIALSQTLSAIQVFGCVLIFAAVLFSQLKEFLPKIKVTSKI